MNLLKFKNKIDEICEAVVEDGRTTDDIEMAIQIDGPGTRSIYATDIEIHYDNDCQASGCVVLGEYKDGCDE